MPCGGIYPVDKSTDDPYYPGPECRCFHCNESMGGPWSFVEEWDAFIHDDCIDEFLKTPEGKIIISHEHEVVRR